MSKVDTVKIKSDGPKGYRVINASDFDSAKHKPFDEKAKAPQPKESDAARKIREDLEAQRQAQANYGQVGGAGGLTAEDYAKNPSGTYSEPTPTDIRYPDKDATEFENNHGAFVRRSAAELRQELDMPDEPGGITGGKSVTRGPRGYFYVTQNGERQGDGFKTEEEARAAMNGGSEPKDEAKDAKAQKVEAAKAGEAKK